jgi:prepilin-type N-terminal cleavage/methylation domain-containing protein
MRRTGLTLIEVLVALLVMALMAQMSRLVIDGMLRSQAVKDFIAQKYDGAVIPAA